MVNTTTLNNANMLLCSWSTN